MHKLSPVHIAASVVIAVAGTAAFAQGAKPAAAGSVKAAAPSSVSSTGIGMTGKRIDVAPRIQAAPPTNTLTNSNSGGAVADGTSSGGSTSTSTSTGGASSTNTASSSGSSGTASGTVAGSTVGNAGDVTAAANATNMIATPVLINGIVGAAYESDRVFDERDAMAGAQYVTANGVTLQPVVTDTARAGASIDRVVRQAQRDRSKIGRNGQLLYSIAPRTSVDRSNEMPDDGPTAALKGPLSR